MMNRAEQVIRKALEETKTFDPHCHLRLEKPTADTLADILQYHHVWIELVSSGMGQREVAESGLPQELADPGLPALERAARILKHLPNIENTTLGMLLRWLLKDLYGIDALTQSNLEQVGALVESRGRDRAWIDELLGNRCGILASASVEYQGAPCSPALLRARELFVMNLVNGKQSPAEILAGWEKSFGREIRNAADYQDFLRAMVESLQGVDFRFIGLWVLPYLASEPPAERSVTTIIEKARGHEQLSQEEVGAFCTYGVVCLLELLRKTSIRLIQLIVGAEVLLPHRSVTQWDGAFCGSLGRLANRFEDFHFSLSAASDAFTQDLGILAKHLPNISVAGYWWHTLYPFYLRKSIETRLDMVPLNKIIAYFSDAYHAEWCYPKLKLVKQVMLEILSERVARGWYGTELALRIVRMLFYENPMAIYGFSSSHTQ